MNVLSFSGGRTSAYMLYLFKDRIDEVIFCNTGKEAEGTLDFVRKCGEYFDIPITWLEYTSQNEKKYKVVDYNSAARNGEPFAELIRKIKYIPNAFRRTCTGEMKIKTIHRYLKGKKIDLSDVNMYLGIRADEPSRYYKLKDNTKNKWESEMPLFKLGVSQRDVLEFWRGMPFDLNIDPHLGNCDLCFHKKTAKKLAILRKFPEKAQWWIDMEEEMGYTFNANKVSFTDILNLSKSQLTIDLDFGQDTECSCNID